MNSQSIPLKKIATIETGSWILIISEMPLMQLGKIKN